MFEVYYLRESLTFQCNQYEVRPCSMSFKWNMYTTYVDSNENLSHIKEVNENVPSPSQIKIKQRYVWTKREFTEEGSLLGELVDQVSPLTVQMSLDILPSTLYFSVL